MRKLIQPVGDRRSRLAVLAVAMLVVVAGGAVAAHSAKLPNSIAIGHRAPPSLDPHTTFDFDSWEIINQLFVGLTRYDKRTGELRPDLAESYTVSPDQLTWTFTLRDARWSDGSPITADDVAFSIARAKDPATGGTADTRAMLADIESATAITPLTVDLRLTRPIAYLPAILSVPTARPVPRHAVELHGSGWLDPANIVVSGAYTLTARSPEAILLEQNKRYYGASSIERVVYDTGDRTRFPDRYAAGELDFLPTHVLLPPAQPPVDYKSDARLAADLVIADGEGTEYLVFNAAHGPTVNMDVRRALSAATDRARIAAAITGDESLATTTLTEAKVFGSVPEQAGIGQGFDPAAAVAYKEAAGTEFPTSITLRYVAGNQTRARYAAILKEDWERILGPGFTVNLEGLPAGQVFGSLTNPDPAVQASVTTVGWISDWPDADNFLRSAVGATQTRWSHEGYRALVDRAGRNLEADAREAGYAAAEWILNADEAAIAPLYTRPDAYAKKPQLNVVGDRIENWSVAGA